MHDSVSPAGDADKRLPIGAISALREWQRSSESDPHTIDYVNALADWWGTNGKGVLLSLRDHEAAITSELRDVASKFGAWFRAHVAPDADMGDAIRKRILAQRDSCQRDLDEWVEGVARLHEIEAEKRAAGQPSDWWGVDSRSARRRREWVSDCNEALSLFADGTERWKAFRETLANIVEEIDRLGGEHPWRETSLIDAIGCREVDGHPVDFGIWAINVSLPYVMRDDETDANGNVTTIIQRGFGPDQPADRLVGDAYREELKHRLNRRTLPTNVLRDFRHRLHESAWFHAFLIDWLLRCETRMEFDVLVGWSGGWLHELDRQFAQWQMTHNIERHEPQSWETGSRYSFAFDFGYRMDWRTYRQWHHDDQNPAPQSAHIFAVALRFLVSRLVTLAPAFRDNERLPLPADTLMPQGEPPLPSLVAEQPRRKRTRRTESEVARLVLPIFHEANRDSRPLPGNAKSPVYSPNKASK